MGEKLETRGCNKVNELFLGFLHAYSPRPSEMTKRQVNEHMGTLYIRLSLPFYYTFRIPSCHAGALERWMCWKT